MNSMLFRPEIFTGRKILAVVELLHCHSTCNSGALAAPDSKASAVRVPVPVMTKTIALPAFQVDWFTTACTSALKSGVFCAAPRSPCVHAGGDHATLAPVSGRFVMLLADVEKAEALALSSALSVRLDAPLSLLSASNWM